MKKIGSLWLLSVALLLFSETSLNAQPFVRIRIQNLNGRTTECFSKECNNLWCKIPKGTYARVLEKSEGPGIRVQLLAKNAEDMACCGLPVWVYKTYVDEVVPSAVPRDLEASPIPFGYGEEPGDARRKWGKHKKKRRKARVPGIGGVCEDCNLNLLECGVRKSGRCVTVLKKYICCDSPWKGVSMSKRLDLIFRVLDKQLHDPYLFHSKDPKTQKRRDLSFVDKYTLACVIIKETGVIDPLSVTHVGCGVNTASGLGHVNKPTLRDLIRNGFVSGYVPRDSGETDGDYFNRLWREYGRNPELQLEVMVATMKRKAEFSSLAWSDYSFLDESFGLRKDQWGKRKLVRTLAHYYGAGDTARLQKSIKKLRKQRKEAVTIGETEKIDCRIQRFRGRMPAVEKETLDYVHPIVACSDCMRKATDRHRTERDNCVQKIKKHHVIFDVNGPGKSPVSVDDYLRRRFCRDLVNAMGKKVECP